MSQYNQVNSNASNNKKYILSWVITAVLLACCVYLFISRNKIATENAVALKQKQQVIDSAKTDRTYLQADFEAASAKIDQLISKTTGLKDSMQGDKVIIAGLRAKIKDILGNQKASQTELMNARSMIYMLNDKLQSYELYIAELE